MTFITFLIGSLIMIPEDLLALAQSAAATVLSGANIYFTYFLDSSYFATDSATEPMLHMWSLGVEEQFYLVWPFLLLLFTKTPRRVVWGFAIVILVSLAVSIALLQSGQSSWAYYMLPSRAFQLAFGALMFAIADKGVLLSRPAAILLGGIGAALLVACATVLTSENAYPGLAAVPVTLGAGLLLFTGRQQAGVSAILTDARLRWFGKISFSLYLWHWPIVAYQKYLGLPFELPQQIVSLLVIIGLSALTYHLVENPARHSQLKFGAAATRFLVFPGLAVLACSSVLISTQGIAPWINETSVAAMERRVQAAYSYDFVCQASTLTPELLEEEACLLGAGRESPKVVLYGDSHAAHYVWAIRDIAEQNGFRFRNFEHSSCPPIQGDPGKYTSELRREPCRTSHQVAHPRLSGFDVVILGASWDTYDKRSDTFRQEALQFMETLIGAGSKIVLLGTAPRQSGFDRECLAKRVRVPWVSCENILTDYEIPEINVFLSDFANSRDEVWYLEPAAALCNDGRCDAFDAGLPLYFDSGHLSQYGSQKVGAVWLQQNNELASHPLASR